MSTGTDDGFATAADFFAGLGEKFTAGRLAGTTGVVCFEITDAGAWTVELANGESTVVSGDTGACDAGTWDAKVITDEERFLSIVEGKASARRLLMTGKLKVKGQLQLAIKLDTLLASPA